MFSRNQTRNNYGSTVKSARTKARTRNMAVWCVGVFFVCCLLVAVASPWTATGSNQIRNATYPGAQSQVAASSSEDQNSVSLLGNYLGSQNSKKAMNAPTLENIAEK